MKKNVLGCIAAVPVPVSYTHLDVYKRQEQSDCSKNTSHFFGGNPDGADDCEGLLEVGSGDSGGGGGSNFPLLLSLIHI